MPDGTPSGPLIREQDAIEPKETSPNPRTRLLRRLWAWALVVALGTAAGVAVERHLRDSARRAAEDLARAVAARVSEARTAHRAGQPEQARQDLEAARVALEAADGGRETALYATVLVELAAVRTALGAPPGEARDLLAAAWEVPGLPPDLRLRIAQDAAALAAAEGDAGGARAWARRARQIDPDAPWANRILGTLDLVAPETP
ncbi:hypothetical protein [Deferrisoma sp.]